MGLIVLDTTQIKNSLIPSIEKTKNSFDSSIDTINLAINNHSNKNENVYNSLKRIKNEITQINEKVVNIKNEIQEKVVQKEKIDNKNNEAIKSLTGSVSNIKLGGSAKGFIANNENVKIAININTDQRFKKTNEATKSKMTNSKVTTINNKENNNIIDTGANLSKRKSQSVIQKVGSALKKTGAAICSGVKAVWNGIKSFFKKGRDIVGKTLASMGNVVLSFSKGVVNFVESIRDFGLIAASAAGTVFTGTKDIIRGIKTGNWDFKKTKDLWDGTKSLVKYDWSNELDQKLGLRQKLDKYAYSPFKTTGTIGKVAEGAGYIAGVIALTAATAGAGSTVLAAGGGNGLVAGSAAASTTGATLTVSSSALVSGGIAAAAGVGKNTSAAWNDGASILGGLGYGITKGLYEGAEMTIGYAINGFKPFKGTGMASQVGNTGVHVALDAADGASGAFMDPLFSMIYSPNEENKAQIMYCVNYDKNGNKISDKKWEDLSFSEKYAAIFKLKGGWSNVGIQAASAAVMSLASEIPDIASVKRANATYKKMSADGLTDATVTSIQNLKGNSLKNFLTKADEGGNLGLVTSKLTAKQLTNTFSLLDKVTLKKVIDNVSESQVHEIIATATTQTLDLFTKNLSIDRFKQLTVNEILTSQEYDKILKYLSTEQVNQLRKEGFLKYHSSLPDNIRKEVIEGICKERKEYFDYLEKEMGKYGVDQGSIRKLTKYKVKGRNFLKNEDRFIEFVDKYTENDGKELLYRIKNSENISVNDYRIIRDYFIDYPEGIKTKEGYYIYPKVNFEELNKLLSDNFEFVQNSERSYLKNKLIKAGFECEVADRILESIDTVEGICSYGEISNIIFYNYKNNRELFKRDFGFDMYKVVDGKEVLNDSELLLDMYMYMNTDAVGGKLFTHNANGDIIFNEGLLSKYNYDDKQVVLSSYERGIEKDLIDKYLKSKNQNLSFDTYQFKDIIYHSSADLSKFTETIKKEILDHMQYGYDIHLGGVDGHLIGKNNEFYKFSGGHAMYVTGIEDNNIIVNSWGKKWKIPIGELKKFGNYSLSFNRIGGIG